MDLKDAPYDLFSGVLDAAVDGIVVIDKQGAIQRVNQAITRMFGYESDELIGKNIKILMPGTDSDQHDNHLGRFNKTGMRKVIGIGRELNGQKKDKHCFPIHVSVGHIEDDRLAGNGSYFIGIIRDLTLQKHNEQQTQKKETEIQQLRERLAHVARISTLGEMVTGIAHEINQPLAAITSYAQGCSRMINTGLKDPDELLQALGEVSAQAERAAKVITGIRNFSKKSQLIRQPCDCNELVKEVVVLAELHARELAVSLVVELDDVLMVMVEAIQVQQVVLNLINNAIESMSDVIGDKVVIIKTRRLDSTTAEVSVCDSGVGVAVTLQDQVFDSFFTTKDSGLGMGLSICQSLVEAQGGQIRLSRNPGRGCTFSFTLPTAIGG